MCFMSVCTDRRAYYTAPIKALVSEKFFDLVDLFGRENVGMITGDASINAGAPIICCTAEILANQALREGEGCDVGCVAMDEFHFYADPDRGWAWQVPLLTLPNAQFLLMSATLGDTSAIAASLSEHTGGRTVDTIADAPRPVPLSYEFVDTALEGTVELALRAGEAPLYIVHFAQDAALASAQSLASYGVSTKEQREAIKEAIKGTRFTTTFGKTLQRLLGCGVGVHHAGMLPRYRLLVEKLAQQGLLPVICGTDTLGVGINVPSTPWCSPRSRSLTGGACVTSTRASSTRSWAAPDAPALTPRATSSPRPPNTTSRTPARSPRRAETPRRRARSRPRSRPRGS